MRHSQHCQLPQNVTFLRSQACKLDLLGRVIHHSTANPNPTASQEVELGELAVIGAVVVDGPRTDINNPKDVIDGLSALSASILFGRLWRRCCGMKSSMYSEPNTVNLVYLLHKQIERVSPALRM
jgi:hypothetical protein